MCSSKLVAVFSFFVCARSQRTSGHQVMYCMFVFFGQNKNTEQYLLGTQHALFGFAGGEEVVRRSD